LNPVDDFLALKSGLRKQAADDLGSRKKRELEMWEQWKSGGMKPQQLQPLLQSLKPLINQHANVYAGRVRDIPPAAIRAEFTNQIVQALQTYDPTRAALGTHIGHQLKKARRFITTYQNPARIPETRVYKIRELQDAEQILDERFGRPPTQLEVADHLKWSPRQVELLQKEVRKAWPTSKFEADPYTFTPSRHAEIVRLLPYDLTPDERQVFEYIQGIGGKPKLEPGQIAKKLGMSAPKVSRLKSSIAQKYAKYDK